MYRIKVPSTYDPSQPTALLLHFHGWGENCRTTNANNGRVTMGGALANGLTNTLVAAVCGYDDGQGRGWGSWNGAGTTTSPGPDGRTCAEGEGNYPQIGTYCYPSCGGNTAACTDGCSWTTCEDSVQEALWVHEDIAANFCVDPRRISASGESNGAVFVHALAAD